jgi:hypothetical protein
MRRVRVDIDQLRLSDTALGRPEAIESAIASELAERFKGGRHSATWPSENGGEARPEPWRSVGGAIWDRLGGHVRDR